MLGRDISSLGTTNEEQEVDGSKTGWLSFACRCKDVASQERRRALLSTKQSAVASTLVDEKCGDELTCSFFCYQQFTLYTIRYKKEER